MKFATCLILAAALFVRLSAIQVTCSSVETIYSFKFGRWNATVIQDGVLLGTEQFFNVPAFVVLRLYWNYYAKTRFESSQNTLLLRDNKDVVLIDVGSGGNLLHNLRELDVAPGDVTVVLLTHAHIDHIGSLVDEFGTKVFPNAVVYMNRIEHEFWSLPVSEISRRFPKLPVELGIVPSVMALQFVKSAYSKRIQFLNERESPIQGITPLLTPGHTVGHMAFVLRSGGQKLMVTGDVILSRTTLIQHPDWIFIGDTNSSQAVQTRYQLLNKLADDDLPILSYHERFPGIGYVVRDANGFDFAAFVKKD